MEPAPIRRLVVSGIGVGAYGVFQGLAAVGVPVEPALTAIVGVLGGTLGSVAANALDSVDAVRLRNDGDLLANHDLRRLIGQAIGAVLTEVADELGDPDHPDDEPLRAIARHAPESWLHLGADRVWAPDFAEIDESEVADTLAKARADAAAGTALDQAAWRPLVRGWATNCCVTLSDATLDAACAALVKRLWPAVPELLKHDLARNEGRGFAAYQIQVYSLLLTRLDAIEDSLGPSAVKWDKLEGWIKALYKSLSDQEKTRLKQVWADLSARLKEITTQLRAIKLDTEEIKANTAAIKDKFDRFAEQSIESTRATITANPTIQAADDFFTGRHELRATLREAATSGEYLLYNTIGLGGVGKTELARKLAEDVRDVFPRQIEVDFFGHTEGEPPLDAETGVRRVLEAAFPGQPLPEEAEQLAAVYHSNLAGQQVFLLCDNVAEREQLALLTPPPKGCFLLVTSRNRLADFGVASQDVSCLLRSESVELLGALFGGHSAPTPAELDALADACVDHAKTLRVAAADAVESLLRAGELAAQINGAKQAWEEGRPEADRALGAFEATLELSLSRLTDDERRAWRACALFASDFDAPAAAAVLEVGDSTAARRLLGKLASRSLLSFDRNTDRFRMHDLVRTVAVRRLKERHEAEAAFLRFARYYIALLDRADDLYGGSHDPSGIAVFDREAPHLATLHAALITNASYEHLLPSLARAGTYLYPLRLSLADQINLLLAALRVSERTRSEVAVAAFAGNLGVIYRTRGELDRAEEMHKKSLAIEEELGRREGMASDYGNLGLIYQKRGELDRAEEITRSRSPSRKNWADAREWPATTATWGYCTNAAVNSIRLATTGRRRETCMPRSGCRTWSRKSKGGSTTCPRVSEWSLRFAGRPERNTASRRRESSEGSGYPGPPPDCRGNLAAGCAGELAGATGTMRASSAGDSQRRQLANLAAIGPSDRWTIRKALRRLGLRWRGPIFVRSGFLRAGKTDRRSGRGPRGGLAGGRYS